jgi:hypothetical protein
MFCPHVSCIMPAEVRYRALDKHTYLRHATSSFPFYSVQRVGATAPPLWCDMDDLRTLSLSACTEV